MRPVTALRRLGLRARLTLALGTLFLFAGLGLLVATYTLVERELEERPAIDVLGPAPDGPATEGSPQVGPEFTARDAEGNEYVGEEAIKRLDEEQEQIRSDAARTVLTQGTVALLVVGGIAVAFVWMVSSRILAPLRRVTDTARRIAEAPAVDRGLHERIDITGRQDEIHDLALSFDTMLERLDESFDGQRRFVANASHELRTPLTVGRALIELAMKDPDAPPELRKLGNDLLHINQRHERLIDGLLTLARTDHQITDRSLVDLADVVEHVVAQQPRTELRIETDLGEATTQGDAVLLERLVHNLVENATRYNRPDGWVRVRCRAAGESVELEVANTGPVVPDHEVAGLFQPFRRLEGDRIVAGGAGLGLSIVASIARAHGGEVAGRARPEGGLIVKVRLAAQGE